MQRKYKVVLRAAAAAVLFGVTVAGLAWWRASRAIRSATEDVRNQSEFAFKAQPFAPATNIGFEVISSPSVFTQAARFENNLYIAGPAGLMEYNPDGKLIRTFAAGRELPSSPLVAVTTGVLSDSKQPELIVATADAGLLAFNGRSLREIVPARAEARAITSVLASGSGHLLIGTKKRGVLVYDGEKLQVLHPSLDGVHVTALAGSEADLWVGTIDRGVLHFHSGQTEKFDDHAGLPDPQVMALATSGDRVYAGTATGVAVFQGGKFARVLAPGVLTTSLLATPTELYVGSEDQGVVVIPLAGRRPNPNLGPGSKLPEVRQLFASGDEVFAVARDGLYRMKPRGFAWQQVLNASASVLTDRNISALAFDGSGRLWVGYFDRGLDLLASDRSRVRHVEDEHVFCVNRILADPKMGVINVATANGLVRFSNAGTVQQVLTRADGLIAEHVTDVVEYRDGLAVATPAGLTFLDANGARSMYAFHGLVNNHVYALGVAGDELLAGTLGGVSVLNKGDIQVNFTTANSNLKHNWITAVVPVGAEWMVGTYGAGILRLDSTGRFQTLEIASGDFEVNPNAMLVTPSYVLAGTLGQGLYVYERQSGRWSVIRDGLPSENVTALAAVNGYVYIGTDNGLVRIAEQKLHS